MKNRNSIIWVSQLTYRWAQHRWHYRNVMIDTYIDDRTILITKPGYMFNKKRKRRVRIDIETFERETATWEPRIGHNK